MRILETCLYAEDLEAAHDFYHGILGLEVISFDAARDLFMKCGDGVLIVFKASRTLIADSVVPPHGTSGPGHVAFSATDDELVVWEEKLVAANVEIIERITWRNGAKSIYFLDPALNVIEFATPRLWGLGDD